MFDLTDARFWNESKKGLSAASSMMPLMPETKTIPSGPLDLRRGPKLTDPVALKALRERLRGHATSPAWLPADGGPLGEAVADLRKMHVERCIRAHRALATAREVEDEFTEEDRRHVEALRVAVAAGKDTPADERTAEADRDARRQALRERVEAEVVGLANVVDHVVSELREREDALIATLTEQLGPAQEKRVEAERLLDEARRSEWSITMSARWLHGAADAARTRTSLDRDPRMEPRRRRRREQRGGMTFFHPEAVSADEDAQMTSYMRKYFPGSDGPQEPGERLADLAGVEVADLEGGDVVDDYVAKRLPGGRR